MTSDSNQLARHRLERLAVSNGVRRMTLDVAVAWTPLSGVGEGPGYSRGNAENYQGVHPHATGNGLIYETREGWRDPPVRQRPPLTYRALPSGGYCPEAPNEAMLSCILVLFSTTQHRIVLPHLKIDTPGERDTTGLTTRQPAGLRRTIPLPRKSPRRPWFGRWTSLFVLAGLAAALPLQARTDDNASGWYNYSGDHPLGNSRWGVHLEGQWRRTHVGLTPQQLLLQPGVFYRVNQRVTVGAGYDFLQTYRYGDFPVQAPFPEHRVYENVAVSIPVPKFPLTTRLQFEQRHLGQMVPNGDGSYSVGSYRYENRFRYLLRTTYTLPPSDGAYYLIAQSEVFLNFGKNVAKNVFDQNRAFVGIGRTLPHQFRIETGFMEHTVQHRDGSVFEHNHTFQVTITSRLPFFR